MAHNQEPTITNVRQALGNTGSMTTIQRHLSAWRADNKARHIKTDDLPDALETAFRRCLEELWKSSQQIAQGDIEEIRRTAQATSQELRRDLSEACDSFDRQSNEITQLRAEIEALTMQRDHLAQTATNLAAEKAELERRFEEVMSRFDGQLMEITGVIERMNPARKRPNRKSAAQARGRPSGRSSKTPS